MWFIQRKSDGKTFWLLNKEYTIGRRNCTIELSDDLSVSRQHLKLSVDYSPMIQNSGPPILQIMDLGSTYGIFIDLSATNTEKIESKVWVTLDIDSTFQFGVKNDWTVKWRNISVVCSALGSVERKRLHRELSILGAKLLSDWQDDITHLVTDKIMLTQKVLDSLIAVKPIVMVEFFEKWVKILEQDPSSSMPDASQFTPVIGPALERFDKKCFLPKEERKSLFLGKTFLFATPSELKSSMAIAATKAGGIISNNTENFDPNNSLLVECSSPSSDYSRLLTKLSSRGERSIPQNEIGLAILSSSVEVYCNPRARNLNQNSQSHNNKHVLASVECSLRDQETQMGNVPQLVGRKECEEPPSKRNKIEKQISEISQVLQPPSKKIHLDEMVAITSEIQHCDDEKNENALKRKQARIRTPALPESSFSGSTNLDTRTHGNEKMDQARQTVSHSEFAGAHSTSSSKVNSIDSSSQIKKANTRHVEESNSGYANIQHHQATSNRYHQTSSEFLSRSTSNCQLVSVGIKRVKSLNRTEGDNLNRSQWYGGNSPGKLNASKLIVKSNLVRPELVDNGMISQKLPSQLKENQVIKRIKSMKIASLKEGKWTTKT